MVIIYFVDSINAIIVFHIYIFMCVLIGFFLIHCSLYLVLWMWGNLWGFLVVHTKNADIFEWEEIGKHTGKKTDKHSGKIWVSQNCDCRGVPILGESYLSALVLGEYAYCQVSLKPRFLPLDISSQRYLKLMLSWHGCRNLRWNFTIFELGVSLGSFECNSLPVSCGNFCDRSIRGRRVVDWLLWQPSNWARHVPCFIVLFWCGLYSLIFDYMYVYTCF